MNNLTNIEQKIIEVAKMKDIANVADISRTSLNYYFRSKDKLFNIVLEQLVNIFATRRLGVLDSKESFETKIDHFVDEYTELIIEYSKCPHFLIFEITRRPQRFIEIIGK